MNVKTEGRLTIIPNNLRSEGGRPFLSSTSCAQIEAAHYLQENQLEGGQRQRPPHPHM